MPQNAIHFNLKLSKLQNEKQKAYGLTSISNKCHHNLYMLTSFAIHQFWWTRIFLLFVAYFAFPCVIYRIHPLFLFLNPFGGDDGNLLSICPVIIIVQNALIAILSFCYDCVLAVLFWFSLYCFSIIIIIVIILLCAIMKTVNQVPVSWAVINWVWTVHFLPIYFCPFYVSIEIYIHNILEIVAQHRRRYTAREKDSSGEARSLIQFVCVCVGLCDKSIATCFTS